MPADEGVVLFRATVARLRQSHQTNRTVADGITRVNSAWPARLTADRLFGPEEIETLAQDQLPCALLAIPLPILGPSAF